MREVTLLTILLVTSSPRAVTSIEKFEGQGANDQIIFQSQTAQESIVEIGEICYIFKQNKDKLVCGAYPLRAKQNQAQKNFTHL